MGTDLAKKGELATYDEKQARTIEQIELIKQTVAKGCSDIELKLFLYRCDRMQLDPLSNQAWAIRRRTRDKKTGQWEEHMTMQTSIDGYRTIAQRTGQYAGNDAPVFKEENGRPIFCQFTVYKIVQGIKCSFTGTVRYEEYVAKDKEGKLLGFWNDKPFLMLEKCAESKALRMAFPFELGGAYTNEEMEQANNSTVNYEAQENLNPEPEINQEQEQPKPEKKRKTPEMEPVIDENFILTCTKDQFQEWLLDENRMNKEIGIVAEILATANGITSKKDLFAAMKEDRKKDVHPKDFTKEDYIGFAYTLKDKLEKENTKK